MGATRVFRPVLGAEDARGTTPCLRGFDERVGFVATHFAAALRVIARNVA